MTNDVSSARQQIETASQLQPQLTAMQQQLASAQAQIKDQQSVITSSEDSAKKIFSSRRRIIYDFKSLEKSNFTTIDAGKNPDGIDLVVLFVLLPNTPVEGTLDVMFSQTVSAPGSVSAIHNVAVPVIQKPSQVELLSKPISISYFPDPADKVLVSQLTVKDGHAFADGKVLPFGPPSAPGASKPAKSDEISCTQTRRQTQLRVCKTLDRS